MRKYTTEEEGWQVDAPEEESRQGNQGSPCNMREVEEMLEEENAVKEVECELNLDMTEPSEGEAGGEAGDARPNAENGQDPRRPAEQWKGNEDSALEGLEEEGAKKGVDFQRELLGMEHQPVRTGEPEGPPMQKEGADSMGDVRRQGPGKQTTTGHNE